MGKGWINGDIKTVLTAVINNEYIQSCSANSKNPTAR